MFENKNIDELFQEKFENFERNPTENLWSSIQKKLDGKKENKKRFGFLKLFSGLAIAILFFILGNEYANNGVKDQVVKINRYIETETYKKKTNESKQLDGNSLIPVAVVANKSSEIRARSENLIVKKITEVVISKKGKQKQKVVNQTKLILSNSKKTPNVNYLIAKNETSISYNNTANDVYNVTVIQAIPKVDKTISEVLSTNVSKVMKTTNSSEIKNPKPLKEIKNTNIVEFKEQQKNIEEVVKPINEKLEVEVKSSVKKWAIGLLATPIYYTSFTKGSPIDTSIAKSQKQATISYQVGLGVSYKFNKKWSFQTGVHNLDLSYRTEDIKAVSQVSVPPSAQLYSPHSQNSEVVLIPIKRISSIPQYATIIQGEVKQELSYIEVPMELKLHLIDGDFGVRLIGGFSTLFLNKNNIILENSLSPWEIGKAQNLNKINFSANMGIDVDFKVSDKFSFNFSPTFKYHLNTFSKDMGDFKPYTVGVYTGLHYTF